MKRPFSPPVQALNAHVNQQTHSFPILNEKDLKDLISKFTVQFDLNLLSYYLRLRYGKKGIPGVSTYFTQLFFQLMIKYTLKPMCIIMLVNQTTEATNNFFSCLFCQSRFTRQSKILLIYLTFLYILFWFREDLDHPNLQILNVLIFHVFRYVHSLAPLWFVYPGLQQGLED